MDFSSQENKNLLFCPPDGAALTSHARKLLIDKTQSFPHRLNTFFRLQN